MTEFILNYWLEVIFGLVVSGLGLTCKYFYKLYKQAQKSQRDKDLEIIRQDIQSLKSSLEQEIKLIKEQNKHLTEGILNVQGDIFRRQCKNLLKEGHEITEAEWLQAKEDFDVYEDLGGNGPGHKLFNAIIQKYYNTSE